MSNNKVPFHPSCREGWGCHPDCEVLALFREARDLRNEVERLKAQLEKKTRKKNDNG